MGLRSSARLTEAGKVAGLHSWVKIVAKDLALLPNSVLGVAEVAGVVVAHS